MAYIIASILRKAFEKNENIRDENNVEDLWKYLMLLPKDYGFNAIHNGETRDIMSKIEFKHGGEEYDSQYPKGIPSSIQI